MAVTRTQLNAFQRQLTGFTKGMVPREVELVMKKLALDVLKGVVLKTPVDTGRARSAWDVGINVEPESVPAASSDAGTPLTKGSATINSADVSEQGNTIFVVNNVKYIGVLEQGHSSQAPAGMLGPTLKEQMNLS